MPFMSFSSSISRKIDDRNDTILLEDLRRAAALGVRGHHWRFGDMPPVEGLTRTDVAMIVAYVRELQRANGIN